jgi:hypothetical protein
VEQAVEERGDGRGIAEKPPPVLHGRVISEKARDALARLRAKGRKASRFAPYGFREAPGGRLVPEPREQAVLGQVAALRASGLSLRAISRALAARGVLARNGRPFTAKVLWTVLPEHAAGRTRAAGKGRRAEWTASIGLPSPGRVSASRFLNRPSAPVKLWVRARRCDQGRYVVSIRTTCIGSGARWLRAASGRG